MRSTRYVAVVWLVLFGLVGSACSGDSADIATTAVAPPTTSSTTADTIVVTSSADSGPGTLRQSLLEARAGDTITFDPVVFPLEDPASIMLESVLQDIDQGNLMIDASNAGVVLDGSTITGSDRYGFQVLSDGNTIRWM